MKAITLISGGLDSVLAARMVKGQGIEVIPLYFQIPFCHRAKKEESGRRDGLEVVAEALGAEVKKVDISEEFIRLLDKPRYGFGSNMNPCIDCKILMFSKAKGLMQEMGASFVVTGEVLAQRPMSQHRQALELIENRSGLKELLLRPLSAKLLPETLPEKEGWIKRDKLLGFSGRQRRPQMELAKSFGIRDYQNPAGGCLLTDEQFSRRLRDLMRHCGLKKEDVELLKTGRHFRLSTGAKLIVGRNEKEDNELLGLLREGDYLFMPPFNVAGPNCLGRGEFTQELIVLAAGICLRYCDRGEGFEKEVICKKSKDGEESIIIAEPLAEERLKALRI